MRIAAILSGLLICSALALAYPDGPPSGFAGDPPDSNTCVMCHGSYPLNSGAGSLMLSGLPPDGYASGQTYNLVVTLQDTNQSRWGFELTSLYQSGNDYLQGGDIIVTDLLNTSLDAGAGDLPDYLKQTLDGTYQGASGPVTWNFDWMAPDTSTGEVTFYLVGLACDDHGGPSGDYCYAISEPVPPESPSGIVNRSGGAPEKFALLPVYPNPFNPSATIRYQLAARSQVELQVYDLAGRLVATLVNGWREAGMHQAAFEGAGLPSGIYVYRLEASGYRAASKMVLIK